ncbi:protein of unknown function [Micropruina glycogenica]|uniref:Uncharacterized protein n=1 Tax=Micropruina glycogenica TaxID=75385 RepID=A0A2N9JJI5_9ACTN|nr:protein of unknown function [Micropruina glycogenica]
MAVLARLTVLTRLLPVRGLVALAIHARLAGRAERPARVLLTGGQRLGGRVLLARRQRLGGVAAPVRALR